MQSFPFQEEECKDMNKYSLSILIPNNARGWLGSKGAGAPLLELLDVFLIFFK